MDLTLVVMAAGMGSRYGGIKQIDPIGANGEIIIDYSIFDCIKAGFNKVVFVIREDLEKDFREVVGDKLKDKIEVKYAFQKIDNVPAGFDIPSDRKKPWGTGHAVFSAKEFVNEPFAVINADDFYGNTAFKLIADQLKTLNKDEICMVLYDLSNTLSENGFVSRGVCDLTENGDLKNIIERTHIELIDGIPQYKNENDEFIPLEKYAPVSMNMFGFTPDVFNEIEKQFKEFLESNQGNNLTKEFYIPAVADKLIKSGKAKFAKTNDVWYGITYKEDKEIIVNELKRMIDENIYPENLWS